MLRVALQMMLQESGYRTIEAEDGAEATDLIEKHHPDLVVLDMMMPRWGGFAVLEHFQNNPAAPPFIMLTAHEGEKHQAYAKQIGVLDYLRKPYSLERLLGKIDGFFDARRKAKALAETADSAGSGRAMRILVVQQQRAILDGLKRAIEHEGFAVDTAEDGAEADAKVRGAGYDVVVLGLALPKIDGLTLLQGWRRDGIQADILILTAKDSVADRVNGLNLGADDYLTKPFEMDELLARLRALVRRRQVVDPILHVDDLSIDTEARTARRGNRTIRLTPREFDLLYLLAQHAGEVVSRSMIREHLYDELDNFGSNVVDVYIAYLRAKIDGPFKRKLIRTRWGKGYILGDAEI